MITHVHLLQKISDLEPIATKIESCVYWKDINGVYLGCNPPALQVFGLKREDIIGKTDLEMPWKKNASQIQFADDRVKNSGILIELEENFVSARDEKITVLTHKSPLLDNDANTIGVILAPC